MFECECMCMKFSEKVVLAEGQGRRGRWGIKAGDIFVSKQGYAFLELYANVWIKCYRSLMEKEQMSESEPGS